MTLVGTAACGDDGSSATDAPKPIDARVDAGIDAPPDAAPFKGVDADEGGEIRIEYVNFPNGRADIRATAFFYKDSGTTDFFPFVDLNGCTETGWVGASGAPSLPGVSPDPRTKWPFAVNPLATRQEITAGDVIIKGGPADYTLSPTGPGYDSTVANPLTTLDSLGRDHTANKWGWDPSVPNGTATDVDGAVPGYKVAANYLSGDTRYTISLTGSADIPAQDITNALYIPGAFDPASLTPAYSGNAIGFAADTDQTFTHTMGSYANKIPGYNVVETIGFIAQGDPAVVCIKTDTGSLTLPSAEVNYLRSKGTGGIIARQVLQHVPKELVDNDGPTGRRIDVIGVWCASGQQWSKI